MGSQQLLIIVVGVIIVGIMVAVGMTMFSDQSASTNRDSITNDAAHLAAQVQGYYRRPSSFGGGGGSFNGLSLSKITSKPSNGNGTYTLLPDPVTGTPTYVTIMGTGTEIGVNGTDHVKVVMQVYADSIYVDEQNGN